MARGKRTIVPVSDDDVASSGDVNASTIMVVIVALVVFSDDSVSAGRSANGFHFDIVGWQESEA